MLNKSLFNGELPAVRFEIDTTIKSVFHYRDPFLRLGAGFPKASVQEILDNLLHDMIHVLNKSKGIEDFTQNQYHNKHFCDAALDKGLYVRHHTARGWSLTSSTLTKGKSKIRVPSGDAIFDLKNAFILVRREITTEMISEIRREVQVAIDEKPRKQFQLKYVCRCKPPVIIRSGRRPDSQKPLNVLCKDCGTKFVIADATK